MIPFLAATAYGMELSYEQALAAALEGNQQLIAAQLDIESAEGAVLSAKGAFDPNLTGSVGRNFSTGQEGL